MGVHGARGPGAGRQGRRSRRAAALRKVSRTQHAGHPGPRYMCPHCRRVHYSGRTVRRNTSPEASRPTAIAAARPTSSPVRGSVEEDDGSADCVEDEPAVAVFEEEAALAELFDDEVTVAALPDEDVELGADGCVPVVLEWLPEPELPEEPEPPSGSTYCWSPADPPPPAMAVAGTSIARAAIANTKPKIWRRRLTRRVLHPGRLGRRGPGKASSGPKSCKRLFCRIYCKRRMTGHGRDGSC